jgi:hypothetical protein
MSHDELVKRAAAWLRSRCRVVVTEISCAVSEQPDAIGWNHGGCSYLLECKASRADFRKDADKHFRRLPENGMGMMRYYFTPPGLLAADELPANWGLLEAHTKIVREAVKATRQPYRAAAEISVLLSALCRIGHNAPKGVAIKAYTFDGKEAARATLGVEAPEPAQRPSPQDTKE